MSLIEHKEVGVIDFRGAHGTHSAVWYLCLDKMSFCTDMYLMPGRTKSPEEESCLLLMEGLS